MTNEKATEKAVERKPKATPKTKAGKPQTVVSILRARGAL